MPASLRLNWYSSSVVRARWRAATAWARTPAARLLAISAATRKKNSATTFSGSPIVKV